MKLHIELIPSTAWGSSLSKTPKSTEWKKIRDLALVNQNGYCHACEQEFKSLDAHELWDFDEEKHIQKLVGIIGVCRKCHNTIHYGRAQKIGLKKEVEEQFLLVNECDWMDLQNEIFRSGYKVSQTQQNR